MLSATYLDIQSKCGSTLPYLILEFVPGMKPASKGCFFFVGIGNGCEGHNSAFTQGFGIEIVVYGSRKPSTEYLDNP